MFTIIALVTLNREDVSQLNLKLYTIVYLYFIIA